MDFVEIKNRYEVRKLSADEQVKSFNCGDADLNDFILNEAAPYRKAMLAVTYVFEDKVTKQAAAFFSLANDKVSLSDFENKTEFNRFRKNRFVNEKRLRSYPAVKLCRFGVDESLKGQSIGTILLRFIKSYFVIDNKTGCRFITVDAYANAIPFYVRNGFVPLNDDDKDEPTRLLYFDLNEVMDE
jgi:GNAT superfamily N-acetyltransferase